MSKFDEVSAEFKAKKFVEKYCPCTKVIGIKVLVKGDALCRQENQWCEIVKIQGCPYIDIKCQSVLHRINVAAILAFSLIDSETERAVNFYLGKEVKNKLITVGRTDGMPLYSAWDTLALTKYRAFRTLQDAHAFMENILQKNDRAGVFNGDYYIDQ